MKNQEVALSPLLSIRVEKVVVGLSMTPTDEALFGYLDFLKEVLPIRNIIAVHVIPSSSLLSPVPVVDFQFAKMLEAEESERRRKVLEKATSFVEEQLSGAANLQIECEVMEGSPLTILWKEANARRADLLIIGKKAADGPHEILAKNLIRHVEGNTLIIPEKARTRIRKVLVPFDFSDNALSALTTALAFKETISRSIEVQAINIYQRPSTLPEKINMTPDRFETNLRENHQKVFDAFVAKKLAAHANKVKAVLIENDSPGIAHQLLHYIRENDIDLVFMGAKGHSKLRVLLLGSVTEKFLDLNGEVPTWIVH